MDPDEGRQREEIPRECGQGHRRHMQRAWKITHPEEGRQREETPRECGHHMQRAWKTSDDQHPSPGGKWRNTKDMESDRNEGHGNASPVDLKTAKRRRKEEPRLRKEEKRRKREETHKRNREEIPRESGHRRHMQKAWKGGILWSQHRYKAGRRAHRDLDRKVDMWTDAGKYRRFKAAHPDAVRWAYGDGTSQDGAGWSHVDRPRRRESLPCKDQLRRQRQRDKTEHGVGEWSKHSSSVVQKKSGSAVAPKKSRWCRQREEMDPQEELGFWSKLVVRIFGSVTAFKEGDWGWRLKLQSETSSSVQRVSRTVCYEEGSTKECLPLHLIVEHIFTRLSLRQRCQLRCVCKAWNSCLTWDPLKTEEAEYWFVLLQHETKELIVCSSQGCCHPLPLRQPILPCVFHTLSVELDFGLLYLLASAGGLMCARVFSGEGFEVLVFNCLTGSVNVLPRDPFLNYFFPGVPCYLYFAVDSEDPCRYYVLLSTLPFTMIACDIELHFEVFDSRTGIWKVGQPLLSTTTKSSESKVVNGDFFNWGTCTSNDILSVQAYHVAQHAWSTVQVSLGSFNLKEGHFNAFLKYKERLFLCFIYFNESSFGLQVLELQSTDSETGTCMEVATTPEHLCQPWNDDIIRVEAEGHIFYTVWAERHWARSTLVYDVAHNSWSVIPLTDGYVLLTPHRPTLSMCLA